MLKVGDIVISCFNDWFEYKVVSVGRSNVGVRTHAFRTDAGAAAWDDTPEELARLLASEEIFNGDGSIFVKLEDVQ